MYYWEQNSEVYADLISKGQDLVYSLQTGLVSSTFRFDNCVGSKVLTIMVYMKTYMNSSYRVTGSFCFDVNMKIVCVTIGDSSKKRIYAFL